MKTFGTMFPKLVFLLLICSVCSSNTYYETVVEQDVTTNESFVEQDQTSNEPSVKQDQSTEYNTLKLQLDHLKKNVDKISLDLDHVKEATKEMLDMQNRLMEQFLEMLILSKNTNQIVDKTFGNHTVEPKLDPCKSASSSGLYPINCEACPPGSQVYCEAESFDGGWLVVQQRLDGSVNFTRPWTDYRDGFGTPGNSTEFWLGLELLHQITNSGEYELLIELKKPEDEYDFAAYSEFKVAGASEKYRLSHLGENGGSAFDSLKSNVGSMFSTFDQDNDEWDSINYAVQYHSGAGWWFKAGSESSLNGQYTKNDDDNGIVWVGFTHEATYCRMMIRRK